DYAYYVSALIELYNSTLDRDYLNKAELFCSEAVKRFTAENGGFFLCQSDNSELFMNPKEVYDGAIPSGNSVMAYNFARLYQLTEDDKYRGLAEKQIAFLSEQAADYPAGHSLFLLAKLMYENPPEHVTIVQDGKTDLSEIRMKLPLFANISIVNESEKYPLLNKKTTYYVCRGHMCLPPVNEYIAE
ncbi:MAG: thioredoxin domain-containing protein, partial [Ruminococcus sp.]|nr:thioredoxin domain-containing protein [Ruminococcus sp.]